jgi:hypothetical protein
MHIGKIMAATSGLLIGIPSGWLAIGQPTTVQVSPREAATIRGSQGEGPLFNQCNSYVCIFRTCTKVETTGEYWITDNPNLKRCGLAWWGSCTWIPGTARCNYYNCGTDSTCQHCSLSSHEDFEHCN